MLPVSLPRLVHTISPQTGWRVGRHHLQEGECLRVSEETLMKLNLDGEALW